MNRQSFIVRRWELRELVAALDSAWETLDGCGFRDTDNDVLGLALYDCHMVKHAIVCAANYLDELR